VTPRWWYWLAAALAVVAWCLLVLAMTAERLL